MNIKVKMTKTTNASYYGVNLNAVVTLDMEEYLRHVVPKEMEVSWSMEALRAQAVASRSFAAQKAIAQPNATYHITDSTGDSQAFDATVTNARTDTAVNTTDGYVLTHNGEVIEAMFSASNGGTTKSGKTYSSTNDYPYLLQRPDPWTLGSTDGHRVGMSQKGAYLMAMGGYTYTSILGFYYPLTALKSNYGSGSAASPLLGSYINKVGLTCQSSGNLTVRNAPGGTQLRLLPKGVSVTVLNQVAYTDGFGWFNIQDAAGNTDGWVRWDFLAFGLSSGGQTGVVSVNSGGLNVRKSPGSSGTLCNWQLYNGDVVRIWSGQTVGGVAWFLEQDAMDRVGWVSSQYVTLI
jgi:hypothetical protein